MGVAIVRYSEIGLKGTNRISFEKRLCSNIEAMFRKESSNDYKVLRLRGRILAYGDDDCFPFLRRIFGISSYSLAIESERDMGSVKCAVDSLLPHIKKGSFRVTVIRSDKDIMEGSMEIEAIIGSHVVAMTGAKVSLKDYDVEVGIEFINGKAYVYSDKVSCFGGLPLGSQGRVIAYIEDRHDEVAALLVMKRGCSIIPLFRKERDSIILRYAYGNQYDPVVTESVNDFILGRKEVALVSAKKIDAGDKLLLNPLEGYTDEDLDSIREAFFDA